MSSPNVKQLNLYGSLMEEAKARISCINMAATGKTGLPSPLAREFCYLQIRFLCELISLACLVAHGDIVGLQSHKVGKTYSADDILKRMSNLRSHFYPVAIRSTTDPRIANQPRKYHVENVRPPPLDRDKLLALYADSHKYVHRGSLKKLLSSREPLDLLFDIPDVLSKIRLISNLLGNHFIAISDTKAMVCILNDIENNNDVSVAFAERPARDDGTTRSLLTL
jgi:hypothetical protein